MQLKIYVRDNNTSLNLTEIRQLVAEWMIALYPATSLSYLDHAQRNEAVVQKADNFVEEQIKLKLDKDGDFIDELDSDFG